MVHLFVHFMTSSFLGKIRKYVLGIYHVYDSEEIS